MHKQSEMTAGANALAEEAPPADLCVAEGDQQTKVRPATLLPEPASADVRALAARMGLTVSMAHVLHRRGFREPSELESFLDPRLADLTRPDAMAGRAETAERLAHAIRNGERVCVFGDYDCDGITSAAIMTEVLRALGGDVVPLLASRFDGGYGVSEAAYQKISHARPAVLVTCDCGSSDHARLRKVRDEGIDVIVIDHHLVPDEPLPAVAFLNPHQPGCGFGYKGMASCGLALSVGAAVRRELDWKLDMRRWLDLVAIGTIGDVAPLDGDNRALVRAGLEALSRARRPGVRAILEHTGMVGAAITGEDVAFRIAPRINAPGRLGTPDLAFELLTATSIDAARSVAARLEQITLQRREIQETLHSEAVSEIERNGYADLSAIVVGKKGWSHGIVGIVAGRLADEYDRPVIVVGFDGSSGRGSVRGPKGSKLHDALGNVSDCLVRFGGHQAAAGLEVNESKLDELRSRFAAEFAARERPAECEGPGDVVPLHPEDDLCSVVSELLRLEPCGEGNPTPRFVTTAKIGTARQVKGGHLKLDLDLPQQASLAAFAPRMGDLASSLSGPVVVTGKLRMNTWRGMRAPEMLVEQIDT